MYCKFLWINYGIGGYDNLEREKNRISGIAKVAGHKCHFSIYAIVYNDSLPLVFVHLIVDGPLLSVSYSDYFVSFSAVF